MRVIAIVLPVLLIVTACSGIVPSGEPVDRNFFAFEVTRTGAPRTPAAGRVLQIRPATISPRYQGRELVYRMDEAKWEADFYNSFFMPPVNLISEEGAEWLVSAMLFESVVGPASYVRPTHTIEINVVALYGDFRSKEGPAAVLEISAFLLVNRNDGPAIAMQKRYAKRVRLAEQTVEALVEGWNRALTEVLTELEADLAGADLSVKPANASSD